MSTSKKAQLMPLRRESLDMLTVKAVGMTGKIGGLKSDGRGRRIEVGGLPDGGRQSMSEFSEFDPCRTAAPLIMLMMIEWRNGCTVAMGSCSLRQGQRYLPSSTKESVGLYAKSRPSRLPPDQDTCNLPRVISNKTHKIPLSSAHQYPGKGSLQDLASVLTKPHQGSQRSTVLKIVLESNQRIRE